jgi:hypothetical protein
MTRRVIAGDDVDRVNHGRPVAANEAGTNAALVDESGDSLPWPRETATGGNRVVISGG